MTTLAKTNRKDQLTVLVFKDNLPARSFEVPLRWIQQFGFVLALFSFLTLLAVLYGTYFYQQSKKGDVSRVSFLEKKIADLEAAPHSVESPPSPQTPLDATAPTPAEATANLESTSMVPSDLPPSSGVAAGVSESTLFNAFPSGIQGLSEGRIASVAIQNVQISWSQDILKVRFHIEYSKKDGGSQTGRLMTLARGPTNLLVYPSGALSNPPTSALFSPQKGEYFSVARFRFSKMDFGPLTAQQRADITHLQILLFDGQGNLLLSQTFNVPKWSNRSRSNPAVSDKSPEPSLKKLNPPLGTTNIPAESVTQPGTGEEPETEKESSSGAD